MKIRSGSLGVARLVSVLIGAAAASSCGSGGSGSGECVGAVACGGDLVGQWSITSDCIQSSSPSGSCAGERLESSGLHVSGTFVFNADLTYTTNATISGTVTEVFPSACLTYQGVTCAQLTASLQYSAQTGGVGGSCATGAGGACDCTLQYPTQTSTQTGTYSTSGSTVTNTPTGGSASTSSYCVQGSTLTISSTTMTGTSMGSSELVLTKQ
jgi:hypothetical protein